MQISIVNDSISEIELLKKTVTSFFECEIIWTALNGKEAVEKYKSKKPDLILMNLNMPVMDGSEATKQIMSIKPVAVLLITSAIKANQGKVFEAMGNGALDVVSSPKINSSGELTGTEDLINKIRIFKKLINYQSPAQPENSITVNNKFKENRTKIIAIGASTGGPGALSSVLKDIPPGTKAAFIIVQHVYSQFVDGLAEWLGNISKMPVLLAESGKAPANGNIYIAGKDDHLIINAKGCFEYTPDPIEYHFRPSVDVFFSSLIKNWAFKDFAVLLTGMGNDGAKGLLELKKAGWYTIAQDEKTSAVYGMPKAAIELGGACEILPIEKISDSIIKLLN